MSGLLVRAGRYQLSVGPCPQRGFATLKNGAKGRTFWIPGLNITVLWGEPL